MTLHASNGSLLLGDLIGLTVSKNALKELFVSDQVGGDHVEVLQLVLLVPLLTTIWQCAPRSQSPSGRHIVCPRVIPEYAAIVLPATLTVMSTGFWLTSFSVGSACLCVAYYIKRRKDRDFLKILQLLAEQPRKRYPMCSRCNLILFVVLTTVAHAALSLQCVAQLCYAQQCASWLWTFLHFHDVTARRRSMDRVS